MSRMLVRLDLDEESDAGQLLPLALSQPSVALAIARTVLEAGSGPYDASYAHQAAGIVLRDSGQLPAALRELRGALRSARSTGRDERVADVLATYGATLAMAGRTREALERLDQALRLAPAELQARVRLRRAHVLSLLGRHRDSLSDLQFAVRATRRSGDTLWEARSLNNRCLVHLAVGVVGRAEADALRAEQLFTGLNQQLEAVHAMHNRALVALRRGDLPAALTLLDAAGDRYARLGVSVPDLAIDRGQALLAGGLATDAFVAAEEALDEEEIQPTKRAELLLASATAALAAGDAVAARDRSDAAVRLFRAQLRPRWQAQATYAAAHAQYGTGRRDGRLLARVLALAPELATLRADEAPFAYLLAGRIALARGEIRQANESLAVAARYRFTGPPLTRATGWLATALAAEGPGRARSRLVACRHGLDALDEHRLTFGGAELKAFATGHGREFAALALSESLRRGNTRDLLVWSERWRATALATPPVRPPEDDELAGELAALRDAVRRVNAARESGTLTTALERERDGWEAAVRRRRLHERGVPGSSDGLEVDQLMASLGESRMVVLVDIDGTLYALTCAGGRVSRHEVGPTAAALREVEFARFALRRAAHGRRTDVRALGARLQEVLLGPAARHSHGEPVVVVPPGSLHSAPWALLPALADVPLTLAPSARIWLRARRAPTPTSRRVAIVVGPDLGTGDAEALTLAPVHSDRVLLAGDAATVERVLPALDGVWLAHIAAHGTFRSDSPLFSSLQVHDGPLTIHDLDRLRCPPHLVLLSACDTGGSAVVGSDEVLGLVTSLLGLGACGVLASVVPVNDESTVPFMLAVHSALRDGEGLRDAWLTARRAAAGDDLARATAASFTAWGA